MPRFFQCPNRATCGYTSTNKIKLLRHVCQGHKLKRSNSFFPNPMTNGRVLFDCPINGCCEKIGLTINQLRSHLKSKIHGTRELETVMLLRQRSHFAVGYKTTREKFAKSMLEYFIPYIARHGVDTQPLKNAKYMNSLKPWQMPWFIGLCERPHLPTTLVTFKSQPEAVNITASEATPPLPTASLAINITEPRATTIEDPPEPVDDDDEEEHDTVSLSSDTSAENL